jgi:plasmid stabilization system protein ParE
LVSLNWTHTADEDLNSIFNFIAKNSTYYAHREINKIYVAASSLQLQPVLGKVVFTKESFSLRELVAGNYRIIYEIINEERIDILFIHHGARDLGKRLRKL